MTEWSKVLERLGNQTGLPKFEAHPCFCIGPQNGKPLCPCRMRSVRVVSGRYVEVIDHGPAPTE